MSACNHQGPLSGQVCANPAGHSGDHRTADRLAGWANSKSNPLADLRAEVERLRDQNLHWLRVGDYETRVASRVRHNTLVEVLDIIDKREGQ